MLSKAAMNDEHVDDFLNEISMISRVEDPSIIKVYASYEDHRLYYIVTDLYKGGDHSRHSSQDAKEVIFSMELLIEEISLSQMQSILLSKF